MDEYIAANRKTKGFLEPAALVAVIGSQNTILDPYSVLISEGVKIGTGNVFYPGVVIERQGSGEVTIGNNNIFYPGTYILGSAGVIRIADGNELGTGGCTIKANIPDAAILVGSGGRYSDGASIMGKTALGDGSQVLGAITVQNCQLAGGGNFQEPDPDKRAAVLKGFGLARGINLETGQVMNGRGSFSEASIEWQRDYHPKPRVA